MKRVLITGAAGFLGSHLCDKFIAEGYQVIGMDNLLTGSLSPTSNTFFRCHSLPFITTT
jgi:dTDP-glucose 4,6-dehydratase